ncbi:regulator of G-protein signaling 9-like, partial [Oncorhynchus mykiss]|uniref:regulator of G-protein signaling 9-like n=1 Tax=Oncorhynchus mykiss TaxID=8022 RepID=UPI001877E680
PLHLCHFTAPIPHLAVYSGPPSSSTSPPFPLCLPNTPACSSPISVTIDSTPASERRWEGTGGGGVEGGEVDIESRGTAVSSRSRMALSLGRLLRGGCTPSTVFPSITPKCPALFGTSSRVQPISMEQPSPGALPIFFQIKVDIPPECRIYPR